MQRSRGHIARRRRRTRDVGVRIRIRDRIFVRDALSQRRRGPEEAARAPPLPHHERDPKQGPERHAHVRRPGQRVWAHLTLRNRSAETRTVKLVFRVNGDERTAVTLDVEPSWSYRTWGYNTLRDFDVGEMSIEVTDDTGATLVTDKLPIRRAKDAENRPTCLDDFPR